MKSKKPLIIGAVLILLLLLSNKIFAMFRKKRGSVIVHDVESINYEQYNSNLLLPKNPFGSIATQLGHNGITENVDLA